MFEGAQGQPSNFLSLFHGSNEIQLYQENIESYFWRVRGVFDHRSFDRFSRIAVISRSNIVCIIVFHYFFQNFSKSNQQSANFSTFPKTKQNQFLGLISSKMFQVQLI